MSETKKLYSKLGKHPSGFASAEELARFFHETYEKLAPMYSYATKKSSAVQWSAVPANSKRLMIATAEAVMKEIRRRSEP